MDAIEKYFKDLYTSASSAAQEEFKNHAFPSSLTKSEMNLKAF